MGAGNEAEQDRAMLRVRALTLQTLADKACVFTGTLAERGLEQGRADIAEAIVHLDRGDGPLKAIEERLTNVAIAIGSALYMSGTQCADGTSVKELSAQLAAWCGEPGGA